MLKRLVEAAFLALNKTTNSYTLTSSGIAVFHDLTVEKSKSENLAALKALVNETVQGVGLKLRDCDDHGEAVSCLGGREIVDWLVKNSEVRWTMKTALLSLMVCLFNSVSLSSCVVSETL